jgi:hypothetical protein
MFCSSQSECVRREWGTHHVQDQSGDHIDFPCDSIIYTSAPKPPKLIWRYVMWIALFLFYICFFGCLNNTNNHISSNIMSQEKSIRVANVGWTVPGELWQKHCGYMLSLVSTRSLFKLPAVQVLSSLHHTRSLLLSLVASFPSTISTPIWWPPRRASSFVTHSRSELFEYTSGHWM